MKSSAAILALALAASSSLHCGSEVALPSGVGGNGGEPVAVGGQPELGPDPCADVAISDCCEADGCELAYRSFDLEVPVCVSQDRWCYHYGGGSKKERPCPAGYECAKFSFQCASPCDQSGEFQACSHGYCLPEKQ